MLRLGHVMGSGVALKVGQLLAVSLDGTLGQPTGLAVDEELADLVHKWLARNKVNRVHFGRGRKRHGKALLSCVLFRAFSTFLSGGEGGI